ncbi:MAB_1171c family putative transporter [Streptomyces sp. NBC_00728]|uniref:MAB_1171c family putative transporter n=1 Tax=Streptomyces sp. NBC_00728 TaxID=2903676 RepID=UPI003868F035
MSLRLPYIVPTVLLATALALKAPTFLRASRDPDVRATVLLLACGTAVFVVVTPDTILWLNNVSGVANIAAPIAYSLLTLFCAIQLTMIMRWREPPSGRRRRRMFTVSWIHAGIVAALWTTFLMADVPVPRIYDLDTYYATTPWMQEHILLYLINHAVSVVVAAYLLWIWFPQVTDRWLKTGVVVLQAGFALGLLFDTTKLIAIVARWTGHDLDFLSTQVAPQFAFVEAVLVALGFIAPQAGPFVQGWARNKAAYRRLRPLWRILRDTRASAATASFGLWTPLELRLMQCQQRIHDALRVLGPYFDHGLHQRAYTTALAELGAERAHGVAGALALQAAVDAYGDKALHDARDQPAQIGAGVSDHLDAIARALSRPHVLDSIRQQISPAESAPTHA